MDKYISIYIEDGIEKLQYLYVDLHVIKCFDHIHRVPIIKSGWRSGLAVVLRLHSCLGVFIVLCGVHVPIVC